MLAELLAWACRASGAGAAKQTLAAGAAFEMWWFIPSRNNAPLIIGSNSANGFRRYRAAE